MSLVRPNIGSWYLSEEIHTEFEVVAFDEDKGLIEIQYFDGDIEELDFESWYSYKPEEIEPPEDLSGPFELEKDDINQEVVFHPEHWNLLENIENNEADDKDI